MNKQLMAMPADTNINCKGEPGRVAPVIDRNRCEAKGGCVEVCPFDVFEIRPLEPSDRAALSFFGSIKAWAHGNRQAYVLRPDACHACQSCVQACPEDAIRLAPYPTA
ncbi:4Fe-4S dicluster domain-containing protein [Paucibacter soli]|uniref:4Fe-4S dicluster domain-containing protein n=1 Tax=Paucibacter soli TaxID=3133433 RepID=UPI0030B19B53